MIAWLRQHHRALRRALAKLSAQWPASAFNMLVIGIGLSLPLGGYCLLANLGEATREVSIEPRVSIFLRPALTRVQGLALASRLEADARVAELRFVSREEALDGLQDLDGLAALLKGLERNPLPDSLVLRARDSSPDALDRLAAQLRELPGVESVQLDAPWSRRLAAFARLAKWGLALLASLLAVGLIAVTFNTIRLQVLTLEDEIVVAKLLGATDSYVRRPFLYLGLVQGFAGGVVALIIVAGGLGLLAVEVKSLASSYGSHFELGFLGLGDILVVQLLSGVLGWLGAFLAVSKHLRLGH